MTVKQVKFNTGYTLVVFGVTGDLCRKKLIPALYQLYCDYPDQNFVIIGTALENKIIAEILTATRPYIRNVKDDCWQAFGRKFFYVRANVTQAADFWPLRQQILALEAKYNLAGNRLFYCATAAHFFASITTNLAQVGLLTRGSNDQTPWHRIVYEKPFGSDLATANAINRAILQVINEEQIYRIDHYLTKEIVANIAFVRFTNRVFEPLWNNYHIASVHIIMSEQVGLEEGIAYFDDYGTIKDVIQNHALQLLALIAMDAPDSLTGESVYQAKAHILKALRVADVLLGQYAGYRQEVGIKLDSQTETFAAFKLFIDETRWQGVPFFIIAGKALDKKETKICVNFKNTHCLLPKNCPTVGNQLEISIYPDGGFKLHLNAKRPGQRDEIIPVTMNCCYDSLLGLRQIQVYEGIMADILAGERAIAVHMDEIEASWQLIDQINRRAYELHVYEKGSSGPLGLTEFTQTHAVE